METVYHRSVHSETKATPLQRFTAGDPPLLPTPEQLREAFLWRDDRVVRKTATFSLHGNVYETDPVLVGRKVAVLYDPFDLDHVEVRWREQSFGLAVAHVVSTHSHPRTVSAQQPPRPRTGIDYLALVAAEHEETTRRCINFADLATGDNDRDRPAVTPAPRILSPDGCVELPLPFEGSAQ